MCPRFGDRTATDQTILWLPRYSDPRNLVGFSHLPHTRFTYHRTWETGLETEIRVADFNPAFFACRLTHPDNPRFATRIEYNHR
jgi:hypothetical protein